VLRELSRAGHEITLLALAHERYGVDDLDAVRSFCTELGVVSVKNRSRVRAALRSVLFRKPYRVAKLESQPFRKAVDRALGKGFDVLWVHFMETLTYVPQHVPGEKGLMVVLDQHNADERFWATYARQGPPWKRLFARQNIRRLRRLRESVLRSVDVILSVSQDDAEFVRATLPNLSTQVWVAPNGVDVEGLRPAEDANRRNLAILCGAMDVLMNIDAAEWFSRSIFPMVREAAPDATLSIVGRNPARRVRALSSLPGVKVTGGVEAVQPYYANAKVAVAPFRYGGGTKLKVLEAMALGVPVVATPVGRQGIEGISGTHLFMEETEQAFAERVVALLRDDSLRRRIAAEARRLVEDRYSWSGVMSEAITRLEGLVASTVRV